MLELDRGRWAVLNGGSSMILCCGMALLEEEKINMERVKEARKRRDRFKLNESRFGIGIVMVKESGMVYYLGAWMLDVGCWMLEVGCWMLGNDFWNRMCE